MSSKVNDNQIEQLFSSFMSTGTDVNTGQATMTAPAPMASPTPVSPTISISNAKADQKALVQSGVQKINAIYNELKMMFKEREEIIKMCLIAVITKQHVLLLGPPGTARIDIKA